MTVAVNGQQIYAGQYGAGDGQVQLGISAPILSAAKVRFDSLVITQQ
ncbi:MAG: hypothetical protein U0893_04125 [Chloroflexota bacterium]